MHWLRLENETLRKKEANLVEVVEDIVKVLANSAEVPPGVKEEVANLLTPIVGLSENLAVAEEKWKKKSKWGKKAKINDSVNN